MLFKTLPLEKITEVCLGGALGNNLQFITLFSLYINQHHLKSS